eukprot:193339-Amphidinium_carterae.2
MDNCGGEAATPHFSRDSLLTWRAQSSLCQHGLVNGSLPERPVWNVCSQHDLRPSTEVSARTAAAPSLEHKPIVDHLI